MSDDGKNEFHHNMYVSQIIFCLESSCEKFLTRKLFSKIEKKLALKIGVILYSISLFLFLPEIWDKCALGKQNEL